LRRCDLKKKLDSCKSNWNSLKKRKRRKKNDFAVKKKNVFVVRRKNVFVVRKRNASVLRTKNVFVARRKNVFAVRRKGNAVVKRKGFAGRKRSASDNSKLSEKLNAKESWSSSASKKLRNKDSLRSSAKQSVRNNSRGRKKRRGCRTSSVRLKSLSASLKRRSRSRGLVPLEPQLRLQPKHHHPTHQLQRNHLRLIPIVVRALVLKLKSSSPWLTPSLSTLFLLKSPPSNLPVLSKCRKTPRLSNEPAKSF